MATSRADAHAPVARIRRVELRDLPGLTDLLARSFHGSPAGSAGAGYSRSHPPLPWYYPLLKLSIQADLHQRIRQSSGQSGSNRYAPPEDYICWVAVTPSAPEEILGTIELSLRSGGAWQSQSQPSCSGLPGFWLHHSSRSPYISNLAVCSSCRRQGVARQLLETCRQTATQWGQTEIFLHVLENNEPARQLYASAGYQLQRPDPSWETWLFQQSQRLLLRRPLMSSESDFG